MKKEKCLSLVFAGGLAAVLVWNLLTPTRAYSPSENRYLQTFPTLSAQSLLSGRFGKELDTFLSDQFPARDNWVTLKTFTQLASGKADNGRVYFGRDGRLFAVPPTENELLEKENCAAVAAFLQQLQMENPKAKTSVLLAPTASSVLPEDLPSFAPVQDEARLMNEMQATLGNSAVFCDPTAALRAASDRQTLYYRTDHHWTSYGAYTAYVAWAKAVGLEPLPADAYNPKVVATDFLGTLASKANLPWLLPDTMTVWEPKAPYLCTVQADNKPPVNGLYDTSALSGRDKYTFFLGGNHALTTINTGMKNGPTLLLIKDSYAHSFVPFLTAHYETIWMIDPRYFKEDIFSWIEAHDVQDTLVLYNAATFAEDRALSLVLRPTI